MKIFSEKRIVPASAIDENGHVNNIAYLQWCIDVAEKHWFTKAPEAFKNSHFWVVLEHTISYKNPSFEGEELLVETWVTAAKGVKSEREYRITRMSDQKILVTAKTLWCFVEIESQRPARITEEISTLFM
ncbi:acyl-CoA thioesterase [Rasiella rasia]|uniref:Acyl-CoA thioesterase n=1 Tax=Rasiella rasia TaxID=2744027 RepID=A0A6G6GMM2_9FLAO|nr:thioesterase family protein [Rasiella rasia]QIE59740.1 acyl-CoA thioesterase [Rasiella rasia]